MTYRLPDLTYDFSALEPVLSAEIVQVHYTKHHQAYVNNFNALLERYHDAESRGDLSAMLAIIPLLRFQGGGHLNHSIFWSNLAPEGKGGGGGPSGELALLIQQEFGSVGHLMEKMSAMSVAIQGSGWGWLGWDQGRGQLMLATTANQDTLLAMGLVPLLCIDVWEHAYYLQYKQARADYVKNIWNIVNWSNVEERLAAARK